MSQTQAYTATELETLLHSVCVAGLAGQLPAADIWIDEPGSGKKKEPYARINAKLPRRSTDVQDTRSYARVDGQATETATSTDAGRASISFFGGQAYDFAVVLARKIKGSAAREALWRKGVGLLAVDGPIDLSYNEGQQRKTQARLELRLSVSETITQPIDTIEYLQLVNPDLNFDETYQLGGTP